MHANVKKLLVLVVAVAGVVAAGEALAYCLTGVKWPSPASFRYNAANKVTSGQCISSAQMDTAIKGGAGPWDDTAISASMSNTTAKANRRDGINVLGWGNLGGQTLGITNYLSYGTPQLTCGSNSFYRLFEVDVRLATSFRWTSTQGSCPCAAGSAFYLNAVSEHEFGHVVGLCHTSAPSSLMYPSFGVCENKSKGSDENAGESALCY